ncbi:hypothetical protein TWF730_005805 [Orbilia blumenaviensis]|uniref:Uncharacterized protein n=1 Tax=Orbilia blumenaviensis TaxID=1796055 RepID=A0AAV9VKK9_9PEZI
MTFENGRPTFIEEVSPPPSWVATAKGIVTTRVNGFSTSTQKKQEAIGMTKEVLSKVLELFETYLYEGDKEGAIEPYTFLTAGSAFRVLNNISATTTSIDIWSISGLHSHAANETGKILSQSPIGQLYNINFDLFNSTIGADMAYYNSSKLFGAYTRNTAIPPVWQGPRKWFTLYALPIEWQIQTEMTRMSSWYKAGMAHDKGYINSQQHVLGLMWELSGMGQERVNISGVNEWLIEYQAPGNKFSYAAGLVDAVKVEFIKYVKNGGKYAP